MPLTRSVVDDSDMPIDIRQTLVQVLKEVKYVSSKVDEIRTEHKLLKIQVDSVCNKLDAALSNTEILRQNLADATEKGESQNGKHEEKQNEELRKLLECYHRDNNWAALREGLEAILERTSNAYIQLQSVEYDCVDPLYKAGYNGYLDLVTVLLSHEVLLETVDPDGDTMLHGAAAGGHLPVVKLLLRCGAKVDARNIYGRTPLMRAAEQGHVQVVTCLLRAGADKSAISSIGLTALDYATREGHTLAVQTLSLRPY